MRFLKILLLAVLGICVASGASRAQNARQILDKTAARLKNSGGLQATFEATTFKGLTPSGTAVGTIRVQGNKFQIDSDRMSTWFDGTTQWSLLAGSNEVNLTTPTPEEIQQINPYTFVDLYKSGYRLSASDVTYQGKSCHEVRMVATRSGSSISEMRITIDSSSYLPHSIRIREGADWTRIRVKSLATGKHLADSVFRFDSKSRPGIEVIDLR